MQLPLEKPPQRRLPRIGIGGTDVRIRLTRADEAGEPSRPKGSDPFVEVSPPESPHRNYLAELRLGDSDAARALILTLEHNENPASIVNSPLWNRTRLEAAWNRGFEAMAAAQGAGMARLDGAGGYENLASHAPIAYCPHGDTYAVPVCPMCLGPVENCRDEDVLREAGLPAYESGGERFLYCPSCYHDQTRPRVFYTYRKKTTGTPAAGVEVRSRNDLYADLAPRIQCDDPNWQTSSCFVCKAHVASLPDGETLPAGSCDATTVFPLAYYEFLYLVREALPVSFEETSALLGGADFPALVEQRAGRRGFASTQEGQNVVDRLGPDAPQFFFRGDRGGLFALEALYLKLNAFADLLRGLLGVYDSQGRPHLGIAPSRTRGVLRARETQLPARWGLSLAFTDLISSAPLEELGDHKITTASQVWLVPEPRAEAFLPTEMTRAQSTRFQMRLDVQSVELHGGAAEARAHMVGTLTSEVFLDRDHGRHDQILVTVSGPASGHRIRFVGRQTSAKPGSFVFDGVSGPLLPEDGESLRTPQTLSGSAADVTIVHRFAGPSDLYSLGLLFFRLLFWNDRQDTTRLDRDKLLRLATRLTGRDRNPDQGRSTYEWDEIAPVLEEERAQLPSNSVLYRSEDRESGGNIPPSLWAETWLLGLRMVSHLEGWSFAGSIDGFDTEKPGAVIRDALAATQSLIDQTRSSLIGSSGRNRFVLEVCQDFLEDLAEAKSAPEPPEEGSAEMTMIMDRGTNS